MSVRKDFNHWRKKRRRKKGICLLFWSIWEWPRSIESHHLIVVLVIILKINWKYKHSSENQKEESTAEFSILGCKHTILEDHGFQPFSNQNIKCFIKIQDNKCNYILNCQSTQSWVHKSTRHPYSIDYNFI